MRIYLDDVKDNFLNLADLLMCFYEQMGEGDKSKR